MDDSFDAIQSNRAASRKFLSQLLQQSRGLSVPVELQQPSMLHRSPSGAKRKIRQQREKEVTTPLARPSDPSSSFSPSSSSPSQSMTSHTVPPPPPTTVPPRVDNYRRLIDDGGYQSILPDFNTSFSPPVPAPRMNVPFSSSMSHLDRIGSPSIRLESSFSSSTSSSSSPSIDSRSSPSIDRSSIDRPTVAPVIPVTKPTVEVHPMPAERKKEKPAVPVKPKGLKLMDPLTPTSLSPSPVMNRWNSTNSLYTPPLSASPMSTSSLFINQLFSTPSFANLTQSYEKSHELDENEKEDLENRRMESLCSLTTRIVRLQEELTTIQKEMVVNDEIGQAILDHVESRDVAVYEKVRRQLESEKELLSLETKLRLQLEKCTKHIREDLTMKKSEAALEENRIRGKLSETRLLRSIYANREREVERALGSLLRDDDLRRWNTYKDGFCKMIEESREIEMSLNDAKMQLRYLHSTKPVDTN
ncbi:hypothetical protein PMAYCL1PPCAC_12008 [Pristionchus mayeri]|uniref:ASD2 domain-containing protein n=1 Tax=Pristionchus mayeri TaxID=1317129 RepID=A0AAN4ZID8_9BILA|nr:hypothetical protein PMAYCL1PPCAC_12008 [Pristionchus mayeri]